MNAVKFLLASFDDIGDHRWESTTSVLADLTPDEAGWQHPAYANVEPEEGLPLPGTIAWHIAHLEYYTRYYAEVLRRRPVEENDPSVTLPADLSLASLLGALQTARRDFRNELSLLTDPDLDAPCNHGKSVAEFVRGVFRHESWHGGQIALLRRLYRERSREKGFSTTGEERGKEATIIGVHHAQITVPPDAVEAARAFYCGLLGLPEIPKPESLRGRGGFWLRVGDRDLHVGTEEGVDRTKTKGHIAYQVTGLDEWRAVLSRSGIEILEGIPIPGYDRFEFRDPFGNRTEFICRAEG